MSTHSKWAFTCDYSNFDFEPRQGYFVSIHSCYPLDDDDGLRYTKVGIKSQPCIYVSGVMYGTITCSL